MTPSLGQLQALSRQLPVLDFAPARDSIWPQNAQAQAYLDGYQINFAREFTGLSHGFGCVETTGFRIATHYWLPKNPRGTLLISHGYYDHVGVFNNAIRFALEQDFAVLTFDLPGHGLSSGASVEISSFDQYADVLHDILQKSQNIMPHPVHALGQSTGCAVLLNYWWRYAEANKANVRFSKIILCAPLVLARGWSLGKYIYTLLKPFVRYIPRGKAKSSHDQVFNQFINAGDPLQAKYLSVKWVGAMKNWNQMFTHCEPLKKEILLLQGTGDMTVDWRYNIPLIQKKLPNSQLIMISDARHQLVNESEDLREQVFTHIKHYLDH